MGYLALKKNGLTKEDFIELCKNNSIIDVLKITKLHRNTFSKYAKELNCYFPNQGGGGLSKPKAPLKWNTKLWKNDLQIDLTRGTIKKWILKLNLLPKKCNKCGLDKWLEQEIPLELNHINGINVDNRKSNLELICPNCHSFTDSYRGKNNIYNNKEKQNQYQKEYRKANKEKKRLYDLEYRQKAAMVK